MCLTPEVLVCPVPATVRRRDDGGVLRGLFFSRSRAAKAISSGWGPESSLLNERTGISVEMAIRLSKAFGSTPETWLGMQMAYDLWQARDRAGQIAVERFAAA